MSDSVCVPGVPVSYSMTYFLWLIGKGLTKRIMFMISHILSPSVLILSSARFKLDYLTQTLSLCD